MELKATTDIFGLNPKNFENIKTMFEISTAPDSDDCLTEELKISKAGQEFKQLNLHVIGQNNSEYAGDFVIRYLFPRQLNPLIKAFGGITTKWIGKRFYLWSEKDNNNPKYLRWCFDPTQEESIQ